jgi:hypothetical protein
MKSGRARRVFRHLTSTRGSVSLQTVALLLLVASVGFGAMWLLSTAGNSLIRAQASTKDSEKLSEAISYAVEQLKKNPSIEADSVFDPIYNLSTYEGVSLEVKDVSSLLNPNWIRKGIVTDTNLANLLLPGMSADKLQQYREDSGFSENLEDFYKTFFTEDAITNYLGAYSYANINSSDEFALRKLYFEVTQDQNGSEFFHNRITQQLRELKIMNENELETMLGVSGSDLRKVLTTQGQLNVNFVPPFILECLLSYKAYNIGGYKSVADSIVAARKSGEINDTRLRSLLGGIEADHPLLGYLGVRTWFWRITAKQGGQSTSVIVARQLPYNAMEQEEKVKVIEVRKNEN